ncbi:MAG: type 4a pilus biogenesis protein PilO [Planctomycetes bacterium]|nr:type 4a pilus biogenesis protein PilO [Planctomycetota bacterium]
MRYFSLVLVLVATPVMAWLTVYRPTNLAVETVASEIKARTKQLSHFSEVNAQYRQMQDAIEQLASASEVATSRIPIQHQAEQWLGEASIAAEQSNLTVRSVTISGNRSENDFGVLPVNMEVTGSFVGVYDLIQRFEQMERMIPISRLDIRRTNDVTVDATLVLHLLFNEEGGSQ